MPLARWSNKHHNPDFEVTLNYHTRDMLGFIAEFQPTMEAMKSNGLERPVSSPPRPKRRRMDMTSNFIDLTADSDGEGENETEPPAVEDDGIEHVDEEISILPKQAREVPLLDLVDDDETSNSSPKWSSIRLP
jgi:hypothetical protein